MKNFLLILLIISLMNASAFAYEGELYTVYLKGEEYQIVTISLDEDIADIWMVFKSGRFKCLLKEVEIDHEESLLIAIDKHDTPIYFELGDVEESQDIPVEYIQQFQQLQLL